MFFGGSFSLSTQVLGMNKKSINHIIIIMGEDRICSDIVSLQTVSLFDIKFGGCVNVCEGMRLVERGGIRIRMGCHGAGCRLNYVLVINNEGIIFRLPLPNKLNNIGGNISRLTMT